MKTKIFVGALLMLFGALFSSVNAQLKISSNGNVGVKLNNSDPLSDLSIGAVGISNAKLYVKGTGSSTGPQYGMYSFLSYGTPSTWRYAVYGLSQALGGYMVGVKGEASSANASYHLNGATYGVYGIAGDANNGKNYGVYGTLRDSGTNSNGAGVCGTNDLSATIAISDRYAGYFHGNTYVNGNIYATNLSNTSDARLKTDITGIKAEATSKVKELHPIQFRWKQVEDVIVEDTVTVKVPHFSSDVDFTREHYGLLAQEVQKLFPELVDKDGAGYLGVNYVELIPLLIQAVQELSAEVEELKATEKLK